MASVDQEKNGRNSWSNTRNSPTAANWPHTHVSSNHWIIDAWTWQMLESWLLPGYIILCCLWHKSGFGGFSCFHHKKGMKTVKFMLESLCEDRVRFWPCMKILFFTTAQISSLYFLSITERNCYYPEYSSNFRCIRVMCCNLTFIVLRFHDPIQTRAWSGELRPDRHNEIF